MATKPYAVTRAKSYPFLTLQPMIEGQATYGLAGETIELDGDQFEDYEQTVKKFAEWQDKLSVAS